jgi:hypothetical protein
MSLNNDYVATILTKQRHAELSTRAAENRLAALVPRRPSPWRRLVRAVTRETTEVAGRPQPTLIPEEAQAPDLAVDLAAAG